MATKQQKVDKILRLARQVGEQVDLPRQALLQAQSQDLDFLITNLQSRAPQGRQQMVMVQAQARVPQGVKRPSAKPKAQKPSGKKLMNYMKFRAMAMKKGLTEAQTKRAYATYKQVGNAQQAVAKHVTPAAQQRMQQRMQQRRQQAPAKPKAKAKTTKPKAAEPKATKRTKTPKSVSQRAAALSRAISQGKVVARQGKTSPSDYASGTARQKAQRFVALYKGARVKGAKPKHEGLKSVYQSIKQQGKKPYYLSSGYKVSFTVGGGKGGPGIIRKIPGYAGPAFKDLSRAQQEEVLRFLNSSAGMKLRSKGEKSKKISAQKILAAA